MSARIFALIAFAAAAAAQAPVIPVGLDAYRMWDRWAYQRIGARTYMRSTYDRAGGNERADASHFLYQLAEDRNVTLDVEGPGVLYFVRYNHWHGSPWHYEVDGKVHMVRETTTADPEHPAPNSVFLPEAAFPRPLAWTWADTKGGDLSWVPIGFQQRFRMAYSRTFYGTGYYIYQQFVGGAKLSRPITSWNEEPPDARRARSHRPLRQRYRPRRTPRSPRGNTRPAAAPPSGPRAAPPRFAASSSPSLAKAPSPSPAPASKSPGTSAPPPPSTHPSPSSSAPACSTTATTASTSSRASP